MKLLQPLLKLLCILALTLFTNVAAANGLARIKDPDGFTNVHDSADRQSKIVGVLYTEDFFRCRPSDGDWWLITALKNDSTGRRLTGYVHKSRIQWIDSLDRETRRLLLTGIFTKHRDLATQFHIAHSAADKAAYKTSRVALEAYHEQFYGPAISTLPLYFCQTGDTSLLQLFFSAMIADAGSADEMPSFAIASCYICRPDMVLRQVKLITNPQDRERLYSEIDWGLQFHFDVPGNGQSDDAEYLRLKKKLTTR